MPLNALAWADSGCIWDLGGALGGLPAANSARVMLRIRVADDGSPSLHAISVTGGVFTLARAGGDTRGPVVVGGSVACNPIPVRRGGAATLFATFSDAETGGGTVVAAEYSLGNVAAPGGSGTPMSGSFGSSTVAASAALATGAVASGTQTAWLRGRDAAGNWGPAALLTIPTSSNGTTSVDDGPAVDFLASPSPNPFHGLAAIRYGLARAGVAQLELYDLMGRRVRTLASGVHSAGMHASVWDGRDEGGDPVRAGVYFVRLVTSERTFHARIVALD
jgi:hypothetical protein